MKKEFNKWTKDLTFNDIVDNSIIETVKYSKADADATMELYQKSKELEDHVIYLPNKLIDFLNFYFNNVGIICGFFEDYSQSQTMIANMIQYLDYTFGIKYQKDMEQITFEELVEMNPEIVRKSPANI